MTLCVCMCLCGQMQWLMVVSCLLVLVPGPGGGFGVSSDPSPSEFCPLNQGVICSDGKHCCPEGRRCSADGRSCIKTGFVPCNETVACPDKYTCCRSITGAWGCCPLEQAICCPDRKHCCPAHYRCDEQSASCIRGDVVMPWYAKLPAFTVKSSPAVQTGAAAVQCDGVSQCPTHTTCCRMVSEGWGCCPLQEAVCCPDQLHCCPQGFTCDATSQACHKVQPLPLTPLSVPDRKPLLRDVKCDEEQSCLDDQTCCRMSATTWGCCPSPHAVCCSDMQHCCPNGFTCTESGQCILNTSRLDWSNWPKRPKEEV